MECRDVKKLLSDYIDGVLVQGQVPVVKQHLATCGDCKATYESMNRLIEMMHEMDPVSEPADFGASVRTRLETRPSLIDRFRSLISPPMVKVPLGVAAALIVVFVLTQIPGPDKQLSGDVAVTDEMQSFEKASETPAGPREKKGEAREPELDKDLTQSQPPAGTGAAPVEETTSRPARSGEAEKESVDDKPSVATIRQPDADATPAVKNDTSGDAALVEAETPADMPAIVPKIAQPSPPAAGSAEPDERLRITTAVISTGGTIIETEGETGSDAEYLIARLPADSIWSLARILGEDTELITASDFSAFGLQEKRSESKKAQTPSRLLTYAESIRKSRAPIDSIFVRILVK